MLLSVLRGVVNVTDLPSPFMVGRLGRKRTFSAIRVFMILGDLSIQWNIKAVKIPV